MRRLCANGLSGGILGFVPKRDQRAFTLRQFFLLTVPLENSRSGIKRMYPRLFKHFSGGFPSALFGLVCCALDVD
jgi:hypothetical protein